MYIQHSTHIRSSMYIKGVLEQAEKDVICYEQMQNDISVIFPA